MPPPASHTSLKIGGQRGPVGVVAGGDVDLGRLAEFLGQEMGENFALNVVRGDGLPYQRDRQPSLSLVSAGLVPPVNISTLLGMATAVATALVTDE